MNNSKLEEYRRVLIESEINPDKTYQITITVSELELNALEDYLTVDLDDRELEEAVRKICLEFWEESRCSV